MYTTYEETPVLNLLKYFGPAKVLSFDEGYKTAVLLIQSEKEELNTLGKLAVPNCHVLIQGDTVLAAGNDINNLYIIGILSHSEDEEPAIDKLISNYGAFTQINKSSNSEKIEVYNKKNVLIFEYSPETGNSKINIESGNLEFITKNGDINFISQGNIVFKSKHSIIIESLTNIQASVMNALNKAVSSLSFNQRKIKMNSPELNITAQRTDLKSGEMKYIGDKFSATVKYGKLITGKLETLSNDIISKAKNIYNTVDELIQIKAGRARTLIKNNLHIKAKNSYLKSEEDFKINGEKIHLG